MKLPKWLRFKKRTRKYPVSTALEIVAKETRGIEKKVGEYSREFERMYKDILPTFEKELREGKGTAKDFLKRAEKRCKTYKHKEDRALCRAVINKLGLAIK